MKAKSFEIEKGEYAVVATYSNHNDATEETEETTIRTHEKPRGRFYSDLATLALLSKRYWELGDLHLTITKVTFSENDDGRFVKLFMETVADPVIRVTPPRVNRKPINKAGEEVPDPENPKNIFLEAVDLMENRISEYLKGDREQPELPMKEEPAEEPKQRGLFGRKKK